MKKSRFMTLVCAILLLTAMAVPVHADTGPKPSVVIKVEGLAGRECWVTLLSDRWSTGPHSSPYRADEDGVLRDREGGVPDLASHEDMDPVWQAFLRYAVKTFNQEGLYFLDYLGQTNDGYFRWGYYPPTRFKIALYFPQSDTLAVTDAFYERYAFDSGYTVDVSEVSLDVGGVVTGLTAQESYRLAIEPLGLLFRMVLTLGVELLIARRLFDLREKRQAALILGANLVTQLLLNLGLNVYAYYSGPVSVLLYAIMEGAVVAAETLVYQWKLLEKRKLSTVFSYALVANLASFAVGWGLSHILPGLF